MTHKARIKVWSAGCSVAEEAYSVAMMLKEQGCLHKSLIYATDVNRTTLKQAKNGLFGEAEMEEAKNAAKEVCTIEIEECFERIDTFYALREEIRDKTVLFRHDLLRDGCFNEFDVILCRNVLIYFEESFQERVFELLYDSLSFGGVLMMGVGDSLPNRYANRFQTLQSGLKIYRKVA